MKTGSESFFKLIPERKNNSDPILKAFTLAELLITATIFATVSIAVYATFNSGMTVWRRAKDTSVEQRRVFLKLERLSRELRQTFNFQAISFTGTKEQIEFPQIIDSDINRITYLLDADNKTLSRIQVKLAELLDLQNEKVKSASKYLTDIEQFNFSYLYFDLSKNAYVWEENWKGPGLPLAVKIDFASGGKNYATTIIIPTA